MLGQLKNINRQVLQEIENKKKGEKTDASQFKPSYPEMKNMTPKKKSEETPKGDKEVIKTPTQEDQMFQKFSTKNEDFWGWVNDLDVSRSRSSANRTFIEK